MRKFLILFFVLSAALLLFACSDNESTTFSSSSSQAAVSLPVNRLEFTSPDSELKSIEFTKSGVYIAEKVTPVRVSMTTQLITGTYTIDSSGTITLNGLGTIQNLQVNNTAVTLSFTPENSSTPETISGTVTVQVVTDTAQTDLLCDVEWRNTERYWLFSRSGIMIETILNETNSTIFGMNRYSWNWKNGNTTVFTLSNWTTGAALDVTVNTLNSGNLSVDWNSYTFTPFTNVIIIPASSSSSASSSTGTNWSSSSISSTNTNWSSSSISSTNTNWSSSSISSTNTNWSSSSISSTNTDWSSSSISSTNTDWSSSSISSTNTNWSSSSISSTNTNWSSASSSSSESSTNSSAGSSSSSTASSAAATISGNWINYDNYVPGGTPLSKIEILPDSSFVYYGSNNGSSFIHANGDLQGTWQYDTNSLIQSMHSSYSNGSWYSDGTNHIIQTVAYDEQRLFLKGFIRKDSSTGLTGIWEYSERIYDNGTEISRRIKTLTITSTNSATLHEERTLSNPYTADYTCTINATTNAGYYQITLIEDNNTLHFYWDGGDTIGYDIAEGYWKQ